MMDVRFWGVCIALGVVLSGCRDDRVKAIPPTLNADRSALEFGDVKVRTREERSLRFSARTQVEVKLTSLAIEGPDAQVFALVSPPAVVGGLESADLRVAFSPSARRAYEATLRIESTDSESPERRVALTGIGTEPRIQVIPECDPSGTPPCRGSAEQDPPGLDFGAEPVVRQVPIPVTELPGLSVVSAGSVTLRVRSLEIQGPDAAAFKFEGSGAGLDLPPGEGFHVPIRFVPTSNTQDAYQAEAVVTSDDPDVPVVRVLLTGQRRPNLPPVVCANLVFVRPGDGSAEVRYEDPSHWSQGEDLREVREVSPKSTVRFSAWSTSRVTDCSSDPEDGRFGLSYQWTLVQKPDGSGPLAVGAAATASPTLVPVATGDYTLELTVRDAQGLSAKTSLRFRVATKKDLVAQLSWHGAPTASTGVDLDLHLVRPSAVTDPTDPFSGAFSFFEAGEFGRTAGDIHGYAVARAKAGAGDFGWGEVGEFDDPRLDVDDTGNGSLIENISLNYPANDPLCATAACAYKIFVHYYRDSRPLSGAPCQISAGCVEGDRCNCPSGLRCVANVAPAQSSPAGAGTCRPAPQPQLQIFVKGAATPSKVIPVPEAPVELGAPCHLLYVADVVWPARNELGDGGTLLDGGTVQPQIIARGSADGGSIEAPQVARFGVRSAGSWGCADNEVRSGSGWYAPEPR